MERPRLEKKLEAYTPLPDMNLPAETRDVLQRYGLALALAGLAIFVRWMLPVPVGASVYQLPVAAVLLSAWYGGRGPGLLALAICATASLYLFIPPAHTFEIAREHVLPFSIFIALCLAVSEFSASRKRIQAQLQTRQEMLQLAQVAARAVAFDWYIGTRENENRWSPELEAMYGLDRGTFDSTFEGWKKLIHPDDWPGVKLAIKRAHESGDVAAEYRIVHQDGTVRWLRAKGCMLFDRKGRPQRMLGFMTDITDWRHAIEELRASEERFRTLVDRATDAFFLLDEQLLIVDVNRQACESLGWTREELIGMHPRQFDIGLDEPSIERLSQRARGEVITFETRHRSKHGSVFPVEIRSATFKKGAELFYLALARDISDRKQAEERKAKLAAIIESSDDAIISKDLNGIITTWNTGAERIFGYAAQEVIGQPVTILVPPDRIDEERDILERIRRGERVHHIETVRRRKDGTLVDISLAVSPIIDESGNAVGASKIARDISERKRAEEELRASETRFRTLVEFAADGFMLHAGDATIIDVNRQACENLGYSREELIGMKPADFDAALDREALQRVAERVGAGDIVTVETYHRRKDGTVFPVELRLRQVLQGGRRYAISLARDITERKRVEEERERLHRLQAELARVSRLTTLGELTTSIAHEVSQPLGAMVASAGACARWVATDPPAMAEARAALDNIVADGKRAREVIGRIRALAKREAPRKDWLDINQEVVEVLALMEHELRSHDIVVRTDLRGTLPRVAGDRVQLQQVLLNLIVNAVEAMSAVHVRSRELAIVSRLDEPDAVLVEVRDSGSGLDPQATEQVFEAFYTTKTGGIGIGLSISRSIIEAHGGRLSAGANAPYGAVFRFSLPVTAEAVA